MEAFGKYQLIRKLGAGGMAEVFLAREPLAGGLSKILVIKKIHSALGNQPQFRQMFEDEAKVAVNLNHPNIVQTFGYGQIGSIFYLAMEHVEGIDLLRLLNFAVKAQTRIPNGLAAYLGQQVAKGLDYAHRKTDEYGEALSIVHRDISPQNILVSWDGMVKLVDFGIARARHVKNDDGVVKGKFSYMSPEQTEGKPVDARSDLFSMGIVLWELTTLRSLFGGLKGRAALEAIRSARITPPRELGGGDPSIPEELETIIMKALERDRDKRFQTARDLHRALGKFFFELSAREGAIYESGTMAAFMAQVVPKTERQAAIPLADAAPPVRSEARESALPLSEHKHVVVVQGAVSGIDPANPETAAAWSTFLRGAENVAYKYGAHVGKLGETGFTLLLGLESATEDDAARAIRLSLALSETLDGLTRDSGVAIKLGIGVQRGVALVTRAPPNGKSEQKLTFELLGPTEIIAKRLTEEAMHGEVLVGGGVYRAARSEWRFEELESIALPMDDSTPTGLSMTAESQRAKVYRLVGTRKRHDPVTGPIVIEQLVGREHELSVLHNAHRMVSERGQPRSVLILGEAGVGKRSIVEAFRRTLDPNTNLILRAIGRPGLRDTPYALITDLTRDMLGIAEDAEPREIKRRIEAALNLVFRAQEEREIAETRESLEMLLGVRNTPTGEGDAGERRHRMLSTMRRLEHRLAEGRTLVVIVEDMHWADSQSFEILHALTHDPLDRPVLGVATARPTERIGELAQDPAALTILVGELSQKDREKLVYSRFVNPSEVTPLAERILERAGGNPFYVNELLESLIERGVLRPDEGTQRLRWVKREENFSVPTTVEAVVASRLDRLPEEERDVVRRAALLGRVFNVDDLAALHGKDPRQALEQLARRGLIEAMPNAASSAKTGPPLTFGFRNLITKEVAYSGLSPDRRALLHSIAADRLRRSPAYRPGVDDARLAEHLDAAGDRPHAGRAMLSAALFARDNAGAADAFKLLSRALELLPPEGERDAAELRYQAHSEREQILRGLGKRRAQLREVYAMRRIARAHNDKRREGEAYARLALLHLDLGRHAGARRELHRALDLAREAKDPLGESESLRVEAMLQSSLGQNAAALDLAKRALAALGDSKQSDREQLLKRAHALNVIGNIHVHTGHLEDAVVAYAEALVIYRRLGVRRLEAATLNNMGWVFVGLGEYEEALIHYKRSLRLAQELGDRAGIGVKLANIGQTYGDIGDFERARKYLDKAIELHRALGDQMGLADAYISSAQVWLRQKQPQTAREQLEEGLKLARQTSSRYQEVRALVYLSLCRLELDEPPASILEQAEAATKLAKEAQIANGEVYGLMSEALAHLKAGEPARGLESSKRAVEILDRGLTIDGPEEVLHTHALVARAVGDEKTAGEMLKRAIAHIQRKAKHMRDASWRDRYLSTAPACDIIAAARSAGIADAEAVA